MDVDWFRERMRIIGLRQEDVGRAIKLAGHSEWNRMLNRTSNRQIKWSDVEPLAELFKTTPIEIIEHAYEWSRSIQSSTALRSDMQEQAIRLTFDIYGDDDPPTPAEIAAVSVAIYGQLLDFEAEGAPLLADEKRLRAISDTWRRAVRAVRRKDAGEPDRG
jgi:hypothetical protein